MDDLIKRLESEGWKHFKNPLRLGNAQSYFKRFKTKTRCSCNSDKDGIQIIIDVFDEYKGTRDCQLEICAALPDETWLRIIQYILPHEYDKLLVIINRMLSMWEHANNEEKK